MTAAPVRCVVDASVAIKLFIIQPESERADALFSHLADDPPAHLSVPELFYAEWANILWKYTRFAGLPAAEAKQSLDQLLALGLDRIALTDIVAAALDIAIDYQVSVYDGCYIAAAQYLQVPFVTADQHLVGKLIGTPYDVQLLRDFPGAEPIQRCHANITRSSSNRNNHPLPSVLIPER